MTGPLARLRHYVEVQRLQPDINRGLRATVGFMGAFFGIAWFNLPVEASLAAIAAQSIAMVDIRGSYPLRLSLLLLMTAIVAGACWLGGVAGGELVHSLGAIALVVVLSGLWRHLSPDYGMALAITSTFLVLLALAQPQGGAHAGHYFLAGLGGGLWGVFVQVALWPFRAQHPLRRAVADSWLALAELLDAMGPDEGPDTGGRHRRIATKEAALRAALDQAIAILAAAQSGKPRPYLPPAHVGRPGEPAGGHRGRRRPRERQPTTHRRAHDRRAAPVARHLPAAPPAGPLCDGGGRDAGIARGRRGVRPD